MSHVVLLAALPSKAVTADTPSEPRLCSIQEHACQLELSILALTAKMHLVHDHGLRDVMQVMEWAA